MRIHRFKLLMISSLLLASGSLSISSCNQPKRSPTDAYGTESADSAANLNQTKFAGEPLESQSATQLSTLYLNSLYAVTLSKNALKQPLHKITGNIARYLLNEHTNVNRSLRTMATQKNITLPGNISNAQQLDVDKLQQERGLDYESDYINKMLNSHKETFVLLQQMQQSSDDSLRTWSIQNLSRFDLLVDTLRAGRSQIDSLQIKTNGAL